MDTSQLGAASFYGPAKPEPHRRALARDRGRHIAVLTMGTPLEPPRGHPFAFFHSSFFVTRHAGGASINARRDRPLCWSASPAAHPTASQPSLITVV